VRRAAPVVFPPETKALIRACFQQRRKQIGALLRARAAPGAAAWLHHLESLGLSAQTRPEAIPVAAWVRLIGPSSVGPSSAA
jgi:16S rRNA (adenine1518-N6/adenine1519-N6)-dimethyltransferase